MNECLLIDLSKQKQLLIYKCQTLLFLLKMLKKIQNMKRKKNSIYKIHKYTLLYVTKVEIKFKKTVTKDRK